MLPCLTLSIIRYGSRVKWSNPGNGESPSPTPWCSCYRKGSLRVTLDCARQLIYIYNCILQLLHRQLDFIVYNNTKALRFYQRRCSNSCLSQFTQLGLTYELTLYHILPMVDGLDGYMHIHMWTNTYVNPCAYTHEYKLTQVRMPNTPIHTTMKIQIRTHIDTYTHTHTHTFM